MANRVVISKEQILDVAYGIACSEGIGGLSIRSIARECGVAVGTIYHSYPTKADLVNDVVARFWNEALSDCMPAAAAEGDFIEFCQTLAERITAALARFRREWLNDLSTIGAQGLASAHEREQACFAHIKIGLGMALAHDPRIDRSRLTGPLAPEALCSFVWENMLAGAKRGDASCETLAALLRPALYSQTSTNEKGAARGGLPLGLGGKGRRENRA